MCTHRLRSIALRRHHIDLVAVNDSKQISSSCTAVAPRAPRLLLAPPSAISPVRSFCTAATPTTAPPTTTEIAEIVSEFEKVPTEDLKAGRQIGLWLLLLAGMVYLMVVVGGITRLTESGLSIVEWKPIVGIIPPLTESEWKAEFEKYKQFPEFTKLHSALDLSGFKKIFFWEWLHRAIGREMGGLFLLPFLYFLAKGYIQRPMLASLSTIFALGAAQAVIGWWMVKSGLEENHDSPNWIPRVSQYRLATHLGSAFVIYILLLWKGLEQAFPMQAVRSRQLNSEKVLAPLRKFAHPLIPAAIFFTAMSGAFVAGLDAGFMFNDWPWMDGKFVPEHSLALEPWWKNFFENEGMVQFTHRMLGYTTCAATVAGWVGFRKRVVGPPRLALDLLALAVVGQATLGVITLMQNVPVYLGASHQAGALSLLTLSVWTMHILRRRPIKFPRVAKKITPPKP